MLTIQNLQLAVTQQDRPGRLNVDTCVQGDIAASRLRVSSLPVAQVSSGQMEDILLDRER